MDYACIYCNRFQTAVAAPNCTCGQAMMPVNDWDTYSNGLTLISTEKYNPTTRHVTFDCHICMSKREIYIVINCNLNFINEVRNQIGPLEHRQPEQWNNDKKEAFRKNSKVSASLWDGQVQFEHANTRFTPRFFIKFTNSSNAYVKADVTAKPDAIPRNAGILQTSNALVTMGIHDKRNRATPYGNNPPVPRKGQVYDTYLAVTSQSPRMGVNDTSIPVIHQATICAMAHEFGHMLGLPDEYNQFAFSTANIPANVTGRVETDKAMVFWLHVLRSYNLVSPGWGQYGTGPNQVQDHSMMRDVDSMASGFHQRHFVTILEAVNYTSAQNRELAQHGPWTFA